MLITPRSILVFVLAFWAVESAPGRPLGGSRDLPETYIADDGADPSSTGADNYASRIIGGTRPDSGQYPYFGKRVHYYHPLQQSNGIESDPTDSFI